MTTPSFRLDDQVALVTGAASGIGRAIALGLAGAGADVACFDLPAQALEEAARRSSSGRRRRGRAATSPTLRAWRRRSSETQRELGPLTLAVNSAGIANAAPAEEMDARPVAAGDRHRT